VTDGLSTTAMMSESLLGAGAESAVGAPPADWQLVYAYVYGQPLNDTNCASAYLWNFENRRGFMWASGEIRCASYNHYLLPNSPTCDCVTNDLSAGPGQYTAVGFRAARSHHIGGVNLLLGDGSARFVSNAVSLTAWRAVGTRAAGEVISDPEF
jgi:hypothetical protein